MLFLVISLGYVSRFHGVCQYIKCSVSCSNIVKVITSSQVWISSLEVTNTWLKRPNQHLRNYRDYLLYLLPFVWKPVGKIIFTECGLYVNRTIISEMLFGIFFFVLIFSLKCFFCDLHVLISKHFIQKTKDPEFIHHCCLSQSFRFAVFF